MSASGSAPTNVARIKRDLIVHDAFAFLTLIVASVALFGVTLFLFRSFQNHRADLAVQWGRRGKTALLDGRPEEAVTSLRTALSYAPDERADQLLLAQSLADAGHTEEATNYFLNLWEARPGDGFINLQLARLARKRGENKDATDYYRASIFGSWEGDGVVRRRSVRLELVDFLIEQHHFSEARNELFTVAGNAPNDAALNLVVAAKLEACEDLPDALGFDEKTLAADAESGTALRQGGRIAYELGQYGKARRLLRQALEQDGDAGEKARLGQLLADATGMEQLTLTRDQPANQRADHILEAATIAQDRLKGCAAQPGDAAATTLAALTAQWTAVGANARSKRRSLLDSASAQDQWTELIYETEQETARICGAPSGNDALLLKLANGAAKGGKGLGDGR